MNDDTKLVADADQAAPNNDLGVAEGALLSHTYRVEALLGRGGMGEVYRARHVKLGTEHAIKIMLPALAGDPKVVDLFTREAAVLRNVRNEAVVGYDGVVCDEEGRLYLIMEFVDGPSLKERLRDGPLTPHEVLVLRDRLAMGLGAAHDKGVIHRDISPDNVILPDDRLENAKIIDFGIAKLADPAVQTVLGGDFAGKYAYASPEQLGMYGGHVDARSDIYGVGLVLAAAAIGRPLDMGRSQIEVVDARRTVPDLSAVPEALRDQIAWMLQPDPDDRPQSMRALMSGVPERASTPKQRPVAPTGGAGLIAGLALAVVLLAAGVGGYLLLSDGSSDIADQETVEPPPPDPQAIRRHVEEIVDRFECASLSATVTGDLEVNVTGFLSSAEDLRRLIEELSAIDGVRGVIQSVSVRPWPFCAAIDVLESQAGLEPGRPGRPVIQPNNPSLVYVEYDLLVVQVSATQLFDGFLYVDFIDKEGRVHHLFPTYRRIDNRAFAGQEITVGGGPGGYPDDLELTIQPPFGTDMIVAVSTPAPLFSEPRLAVEPASTYLQALSDGLTRLSRQGLDSIASYVFITSRPEE